MRRKGKRRKEEGRGGIRRRGERRGGKRRDRKNYFDNSYSSFPFSYCCNDQGEVALDYGAGTSHCDAPSLGCGDVQKSFPFGCSFHTW